MKKQKRILGIVALAMCLMTLGLPKVSWAGDHADALILNLEAEEESEGFPFLIEELPLGETPEPQEQGEWQVGLSMMHFSGDEDRTTSLAFELEYGLTDWLQVGAEVPYEWQGEDAESFTSVELGLLAAPIQTENFVAALSFECEVSEENPVWETSLLFGLNLDPATLYLGVGYEFGEDDGDAFTADVALVCPTALGSGILEVYAEFEDGEKFIYVSPGMAWELGDDCELALGIPVGLTEDSADWGVSTKLSFEF